MEDIYLNSIQDFNKLCVEEGEDEGEEFMKLDLDILDSFDAN
jgi:hypothetical protein